MWFKGRENFEEWKAANILKSLSWQEEGVLQGFIGGEYLFEKEDKGSLESIEITIDRAESVQVSSTWEGAFDWGVE